MNPSQPRLRLRDRRRRLRWVKVAAGATVVAIALALLVYASRLPSVVIAAVHVTGASFVDAGEIHALVMRELSGSYAYLVPRANAFLAPLRSIERAIVALFPPVARVSISRAGLTSIDVALVERIPVALWCREAASLNNGIESESATEENDCYFMDAEGFVFKESSGASGYVRFYGPLSGGPIGSRYLSGEFASLQKTVMGIGESIRRTPREVVVGNDSKDVSLEFVEGGVLRFTRSADWQATLENVASVFASQSFQAHQNFEYVDFRFGDKVYVKFK